MSFLVKTTTKKTHLNFIFSLNFHFPINNTCLTRWSWKKSMQKHLAQKRSPTEWEKIRASDISPQGFASRLCKELLQVNNPTMI